MNPWSQFYNLNRPPPLLFVTVIQHNANNTSLVEFPNGTRTLVRGQSVAIGANAYIRNGVLESEAPAVTPITLEV